MSESNGKRAIILENADVTYPNGTVALKGCNLTVYEKEFVFLVGSSGSGKSTFIKAILGEVSTSSGNITVLGRSLKDISSGEMPYHRRRLGIVFQDFRLLEDRNIYDNIAIAQMVIGVDKVRMNRNISGMLSLVGLEGREKMYPGELSGGEQQRVAIARAMINKPSILLADEPTGNLDPKNSAEVMDLLSSMNRLGTTVIVVSHNMDIVNRMKKRIISLDGGRIVSDVGGGPVQ